MSEKPEQIKAMFREAAQVLPKEHTVPFPFAVVDAALFDFLSTVYSSARVVRLRRQLLTSGTVVYTIVAPKQNELAQFWTRAVGEKVTHISVRLGPAGAALPASEQSSLIGHCMRLLVQFADWLYVREGRTNALLEEEAARPKTRQEPHALSSSERAVLQPASTPQRRGRRAWTEDVWARQQIAAGRDRELVFREWQTRISPGRKVKNPRDSFWHATAENNQE